MGKKKRCPALVSREEVNEAGSLHAPSAVIVVEYQSKAVWVSGLHATTGIRVRAGIRVVGICIAVQSSGVAIRHGRGEIDGVSDYSDNMGS
jgi:hypothetical protein